MRRAIGVKAVSAQAAEEGVDAGVVIGQGAGECQ